MRYLDKLLGEATNFKKIQDLRKKRNRLRRKAAYREYQADSAAMAGASDEEVDRASDRMWSTTDKAADAAVKLDKLKKKVYLRGGGKGDGKPQGKLRKVEHAAYIQLGDIIAEAMKIPKKYLEPDEYKPRSTAPGTRERKLADIKHKLKAARRDAQAQASREVSPVVASQRAVGMTPRVNQNTIKKKAKDDNPQLDDKEEQLSDLRGKLQDRKLARIRKALG